MVISTTLVIMKAKDATTADNDASKTRDIASKGACATKTTSRIFELLHEAGIPTAYVRQLSDTEILAKKCTMIPLEVIIRCYFDGSYLNRKPHLKRKGTPIRSHGLVFELFLKTSKGKLGDIETDWRNHPQGILASGRSLEYIGIPLGWFQNRIRTWWWRKSCCCWCHW